MTYDEWPKLADISNVFLCKRSKIANPKHTSIRHWAAAAKRYGIFL